MWNECCERERKKKKNTKLWMNVPILFSSSMLYTFVNCVFMLPIRKNSAQAREKTSRASEWYLGSSTQRSPTHIGKHAKNFKFKVFSCCVCERAGANFAHTTDWFSLLVHKKNIIIAFEFPQRSEMFVCVCVCVAAFNKTRYMTGRGNERLGEMLWSPGRGETIFIVQFKQRYGDWKIIIIISI